MRIGRDGIERGRDPSYDIDDPLLVKAIGAIAKSRQENDQTLGCTVGRGAVMNDRQRNFRGFHYIATRE